MDEHRFKKRNIYIWYGTRVDRNKIVINIHIYASAELILNYS